MLQEYDHKYQADAALKNAQLDAQIAEVQKHLTRRGVENGAGLHPLVSTPTTATNQQSVQLLELQRADYLAARPISLTRAQIALVGRAIVDQLQPQASSAGRSGRNLQPSRHNEGRRSLNST